MYAGLAQALGITVDEFRRQVDPDVERYNELVKKHPSLNEMEMMCQAAGKRSAEYRRQRAEWLTQITSIADTNAVDSSVDFAAVQATAAKLSEIAMREASALGEANVCSDSIELLKNIGFTEVWSKHVRWDSVTSSIVSSFP